jgi:hypothetical protein
VTFVVLVCQLNKPLWICLVEGIATVRCDDGRTSVATSGGIFARASRKVHLGIGCSVESNEHNHSADP